jgi:hypothetical protein
VATTHLPQARNPGVRWLLIIPLVVVMGVLLVLAGSLVASSPQPSKGTIYCINDDVATCEVVSSVFGGTGQQVLANVAVSPVCTDEVIAAVVTNADAVLVDGSMPGSQYQGVERLVAVRGVNPRPLTSLHVRFFFHFRVQYHILL